MSHKTHRNGDGESYNSVMCAEQRVIQEG
jgi:hypothetical protein